MATLSKRSVFHGLVLVILGVVPLVTWGGPGGPGGPVPQEESGPPKDLTVNGSVFNNELNRFLGTGGEILINSVLSGDDPATPGFDPDGTMADPDLDGPIPPHLIQRLDVGDRLVGIGVTQEVECLSCPPSSASSRAFRAAGSHQKAALRAFKVKDKETLPDCFKFSFEPLAPEEFSATVQEASGGAVTVSPESIPAGTMVVSFDDSSPNFTLLTGSGSPGMNWVEATDGARHWNIGVGSPTDFWASSFPSDDLGLLPLLSSTTSAGSIRFGLSLLSSGPGMGIPVEKVRCEGPAGPVAVDFCLSGSPVGTLGVSTPFPIGLRTEVRFHPMTEGLPPTTVNPLLGKSVHLGTNRSAANFLCCECDDVRPSCALAARRTGPPAEIDIRAQDGASGLLFVDVLRSDNAKVSVPPFDVGTNAAVTVTATKQDPAKAAVIELRITDFAGNSSVCDPILTEVIRGTGQPASTSFRGLAAAEDTVEIHNGSPGLRKLEVQVNGSSFHAAGLRDDEVRTIDVSQAIRPGNDNVFTLKSYGKPGSSASVLIWEGEDD